MGAELALLRGGGDLATGVAWRLRRAGVRVIVTELQHPLTVRRLVSLSTAVHEGRVDIEGMIGRLANGPADAIAIADEGDVAVCVEESLLEVDADIVVDARLAKRNIDTTIDDAELVIGLGPGFEVGQDVDAIVETLRGHHLGRVLWHGSAAPDTSTPGTIAGRGVERVLRAPRAGRATWLVEIGDVVTENQHLGSVDGNEIAAPFTGVVRGLIHPATAVAAGVKIGDIDPRVEPSACREISDKALAIGGGVVEAVGTWLHR